MGSDDERRLVSKVVRGVLGRSSNDAVDVIIKAMARGYERNKLKGRLSQYITDSMDLSKLTDKVMEDLMVKNSTSRKRSKKFEEFPSESNGAPVKKIKKEKSESVVPEDKKPIKIEDSIKDVKPQVPSVDQKDALKIKELMASAAKTIEERKRKMNLTNINPGLGVGSFSSKLAPEEAGRFMEEAMDKAKRAALLKARISDKLPATLAAKLAQQANSEGQIILDDKNRALDSDGTPLMLAQRQPTLKANMRLEQELDVPFKGLAKDRIKPVFDEEVPQFQDPRIDIKGAMRGRRQFVFHEPGEFETLANRQRAKAKLEKLQTEISQASKKTGISSAVKLSVVGPKSGEVAENDVPDVEWWDRVLLPENADSYDLVDDEFNVDLSHVISALVEHPIQLRAPTDPIQPQAIRVHLTQKERRKLRRQNRKETQREKQEKMRLGLEPPPEPKMKISNLMRVLGSEAVQDPTKMEAHVRAQMARRLKKHEDDNEARKLTPDQRSAKKVKKMQEDTGAGLHVTVYRLLDLAHLSKKFKVEMNAKQLWLTGVVILHKDMNVVVVEGGPKSQKKFKQLMTHRIKWAEDSVTLADGTQEQNNCKIVWEGIAKKRAFGEIKFKMCPLEKQAREFLGKYGVAHYWDMAFTGSILEQDQPVL